MCLNISLARNTASCIPPSDFLLEISQSQINLVDGKLALPAWRDGWLMSVLLHPKHGSLSHCPPPHPSLILPPCSSQKFPADVCMSCQSCQTAPGHCCDPRGAPCHLHCPPGELRDSTATLHIISSLGLLLLLLLCFWSQRPSPTSEFGSSGTSRHYHYHVVI